jgi:histidyl-tRNA synthetase
MKIEATTVKGFSDYLPPESIKRNRVKQIIERNFRLFGFIPIETPIIEFDELMKSDSLNDEDEAISDRFKLKDKGGRNLGLRYEFTFQLARIFKENPNIKLPFKRYQIGPIFRDEPTRTGRTRQFTQCDVDVIGDFSINAELECIATVTSALKELKIPITLQLNNRTLLNSIIDSVEIKSSAQVLRELDKLEKIGADEVKSNLKKLASSNQIVTLFKLLEKDLEFFKSNSFDGAEELSDLIDKCELYSIKTKFNPTMIRGFAYYTGNIFEAIIDNTKTSIAGGGRYDKTIGKYIGKDIPAVGFSFSLEALFGLCPDKISDIKIKTDPKVLIISFNLEKEAISLSKKLRKNRISCTFTEGQPTKALDYANSLNIPYVIFLGEKELEDKKFKLKTMSSGEETLLTEKQIIVKLRND